MRALASPAATPLSRVVGTGDSLHSGLLKLALRGGTGAADRMWQSIRNALIFQGSSEAGVFCVVSEPQQAERITSIRGTPEAHSESSRGDLQGSIENPNEREIEPQLC